MIDKKSATVFWHGGKVSKSERCKLLNQQPITVWLTGLSASGKSTLAFALERELILLGHACYVLDGDNVRHGLSQDLRFSHKDRTENIRRVAEVAKLMNDAGLIVISAFISPYRIDREAARAIVGPINFREVYVSTPLSICESRDPKGLYSDARSGKVTEFTGVTSPYEEPHSPDLIIDTAELSLTQSISKLLTLAIHVNKNGNI